MARILIKESEIRQYIRQLLTEKQVASSEDMEQRQRMLNGLSYDRSVFAYTSKMAEKRFREENNLPPLRKPHGGVVPRIISSLEDGGVDITPENHHSEISYRVQSRSNDNVNNTRERMRQSRFEKTNGDKSDEFDWENASVEEREAESQRIRDERKAQQSADNKRYHEMNAYNLPNGKTSTSDMLIQRIQNLRDKQEELGPHCDANDKKWREYEYLINDTMKILKNSYGISDDDKTDAIVKSTLNDIDSDERFDTIGQEEFGDKYIKKDITSKGAEENDEDNDEEEEEIGDFDDRRKTDIGFEDNRDFFDDDDYLDEF